MNLFNLLNGLEPPPGLGEKNNNSGLIIAMIAFGFVIFILILLSWWLSKNSKKGESKEMEEKNDGKIYPIICPRCGSKEFVLSNEKNHDAISVCKLLALFIGMPIFILVYNMVCDNIEGVQTNNKGAWLIILLVIFGFIKTLQYTLESKTHIHAICKNCGKSWNVDEVHKQ